MEYSFENSRLLHFNIETLVKVKTCTELRTGVTRVAKIYKADQLRRVKRFSNADGQLSSSSGLEDVEREISVLRKINHPKCVFLIDLIEAYGKLKLIFPLYRGPIMRLDPPLRYTRMCRELSDPSTVVRLGTDLVDALMFLRSSRIVHRDIKPDNVLFGDDGRFVISDFGSARIVPAEVVTESAATIGFFPPEICSNQASLGYSGYKADLFAAGLVLFCATFERMPYELDNPDDVTELLDAICVWDFSQSKEWSLVAPELRPLISRLLNRNPELR